MTTGKGSPFLEILASALNEDYRFPILEVFAFLYVLGTFAFASFASATSTNVTSEYVAYTVTSSLLGTLVFIFMILVFKNVAYGLGSDIEKGIIQTYFSYPLKRRSILSAKLLSALGVSLALFLGVQISSLYILAPDIVAPYFGTVLLTYAASLSYPLLIAGLILLVALVLKRGGLALVLGIAFYFALGIIQNLVMSISLATNSAWGLQIMSLFSPNLALNLYYQFSGIPGWSGPWIPSFTDALIYIGASYAIVLSVFLLGYFYFSRRMNL